VGKYGKVYRKGVREDWPWTIHPIWRGIGFILGVLIPFLGYQAGKLLVQANRERHWLAIPPNLIGPAENPDLYLNIIAAIVCSLAMYAVLAWFYLILYDLLGYPSRRRTPLDVPPPRRARSLDLGGVLPTLVTLLGFFGGMYAVYQNKTAHWVTVPREWLIPGPFPELVVYFGGGLLGLLVVLLLVAVAMTLYDLTLGPQQRRKRTEETRLLRERRFRRK